MLTSHLIVRISNTSIYNIPNSAGPAPGTTKNLHSTTYLVVLCLIYCIFSKPQHCFLWYVVALFLTLGTWFLNILNGIRLPLAPVSFLYYAAMSLAHVRF